MWPSLLDDCAHSLAVCLSVLSNISFFGFQSLCVAFTVLQVALQTRLLRISQSSNFLLLLGAEIKSVFHHCSVSLYFYYLNLFIYLTSQPQFFFSSFTPIPSCYISFDTCNPLIPYLLRKRQVSHRCQQIMAYQVAVDKHSPLDLMIGKITPFEEQVPQSQSKYWRQHPLPMVRVPQVNQVMYLSHISKGPIFVSQRLNGC